MGTPSRWFLLIGVLALLLLGLRGSSCAGEESRGVPGVEMNGAALEPSPPMPGGELGASLETLGRKGAARTPAGVEIDGVDLAGATERRVLEPEPVWLQVISAENPAPGAATVGEVAFELHRVGSTHGTPPLFVGKTDANGELRVKLERGWTRDLRSGGRPDLIGRVTEPGYQQHSMRPEVHPSREGSRRLVLLATPGGTIRGRVTSASGQGVDARVSFQRWREPDLNLQGTKNGSPQSALELIASAMYLGSGYFELHLPESVSGMLLAHRAGLGSACRRDLQLDVERPRQDLNIILQGPGSVRGRLTDSAGVPVGGHTLMARLAELEVTGPGGSTQSGDRLRAEGTGSLWHRVVSDENGWFLIEGLRMDRYVIRASKQAVSAKMSILLTKQPVLANGIALELVLENKQMPENGTTAEK